MGYVVKNDKLGLHYCQLAVIKCVDFRFRKSDQEFIVKGLGLEDFDLYAWPGSAKEVLTDENFREMFINKIVSVSNKLHNVNRLMLLWHWDCGGYGGSRSFKSAEEEEMTYKRDLRAVRDFLADKITESIKIELAYSRQIEKGLEYVILE